MTIQEAGLHLHWEDYNYDLEVREEEKLKIEEYAIDHNEQTNVIQLVHLQAGFMLLLFGEILATIVCLLEILMFKMKNK